MPFFRSLLLLVALMTPAFAESGPDIAAHARDSAQALQTYLGDATKSGNRPNFTTAPAAGLLHDVFDVEKLAALPPVTAGDLMWLLNWADAANFTNKQVIFFGTRPGPGFDQKTVERNLTDYEDQYALAVNFLIRLEAREFDAMVLFFDQLPKEQRTQVRLEGFNQARAGAGETLQGALISVAQGMKPVNARLVTAAIHDTHKVWARAVLPDDRVKIGTIIKDVARRVGDNEVLDNVHAFASMLAAAR